MIQTSHSGLPDPNICAPTDFQTAISLGSRVLVHASWFTISTQNLWSATVGSRIHDLPLDLRGQCAAFPTVHDSFLPPHRRVQSLKVAKEGSIEISAEVLLKEGLDLIHPPRSSGY